MFKWNNLRDILIVLWQDEERLHTVVPFVLFIELQLEWDNANNATKIYGCGRYSSMDYSGYILNR